MDEKRQVWWRRSVPAKGGKAEWTLLAFEQGRGCVIRVRSSARPGEGRFVVRCIWPNKGTAPRETWAFISSVPRARRYAEDWLDRRTNFHDMFRIKHKEG